MDMTTTPIHRLLLKLSPPVMLALLIQSVYKQPFMSIMKIKRICSARSIWM